MTDNRHFLAALFQALDTAALEMDPKGGFAWVGQPPEWSGRIPGIRELLAGRSWDEDDHAFLASFIREAKNRWIAGDISRFRSGTWIEKDAVEGEILLDALALDIQGRKIIFIFKDACTPLDKQSILQKGRNLALRFRELQRSDRELQTRHDDLARQLRHSRKMEAIGTLAGGIAHDFNNILTAIIGFAELSLMTAGDNAGLAKKQEKILEAADRAKELVRQILTFSRRTKQEKIALRLKDVAGEVLHLMRASLPPAIEIRSRLAGGSHVLADPTQMHQVLMNLCTNAWHAMGECGTLTVVTEEQYLGPGDLLSMPELSPGRHVTVRVADTGCGMTPDLIERIFDPYFTTRDKDKGTGLGLSVVHGIVAETGGCIRVRSVPGKGSEFRVWFPVTA